MAETAEAVEEKKEGGVAEDSQAQAQSVEFSEANGPEATGAGSSIDILLDMNVDVTVAIGRKDMSVKQILQLGPGSVLKLDKPIDSPVDLYLKGAKFATGNIVVVDGRFAVKIKNVIGLGNTEEEE